MSGCRSCSGRLFHSVAKQRSPNWLRDLLTKHVSPPPSPTCSNVDIITVSSFLFYTSSCRLSTCIYSNTNLNEWMNGKIMWAVRPSVRPVSAVLYPLTPVSRDAISPYLAEGFQWNLSQIFAFAVAGPMFWNRLPPEIRANDSLQSFKSQLKTYYFWL